MTITVNVNGKDYFVNAPRAYESIGKGTIVAYSYWSTRNGAAFGPIRNASTNHPLKSVGGQLVAQAQVAFNADHDAMITEAVSRLAEAKASGETSYSYPVVELITK